MEPIDYFWKTLEETSVALERLASRRRVRERQEALSCIEDELEHQKTRHLKELYIARALEHQETLAKIERGELFLM